jgi:uncharacterized protein (TIGR02444 family)
MQQDNFFWSFSISLYSRPGIKPLLLRLQDDFSADVNMLLCCCWLGAESQPVTDIELRQLIAATAQWREQCILPLRAVRRFLASQVVTETYRKQLASLEIDAERWQQDKLFECVQAFNVPFQPGENTALENLLSYGNYLPNVGREGLPGLLQELAQLVEG